MLKLGIIDLIIRTVVFVYSLVAYISGVNLVALWTTAPFKEHSIGIHIIWFLMMLGMVVQLATDSRTTLLNKSGQRMRAFASANIPAKLQTEIKKMNKGAAKTLLLWLSLSGAVAVLFFTGVLDGNQVLMVVLLYYFCDSLCMLFWCPLQIMFMKSRCCVNCRIYGWGYFFDFGLLLLLPSFFTYSLVVVSLVLLFKWEFAYATHPERFWAGSNVDLQCTNCTDKSCTIKRKLYTAAKRQQKKRGGGLLHIPHKKM